MVSIVFFILSIVLPILTRRGISSILRKFSIISSILALLVNFILIILFFYFKYYSLTLFDYQPFQYQLIDFSFKITTLSAIFSSLISIVGISIEIYSYGYVNHYDTENKRKFLVIFTNIFLMSLMLFTYTANMLAFLFFYEIIAIVAFLTVMTEYEEEETKKAGIYYFVMASCSTFFLFISVLTIYSISHTFAFQKINLTDNFLRDFIFLTIFLAFGIKAGLVPFHKWLVYAHPASPSNISAILSGLTLKMPIYGFILFLTEVLTFDTNWGIIVTFMGSITAILGIIYALKEPILKRMLAYSSIENVGIIFTGIGLYIIFISQNYYAIAILCLAAAIFHSYNHGVFKSLLFMGAGAIINISHKKNINDLGGLIKFAPYTSIFFLIGSLSISALPPFNGFVSELMLFLAFFKTKTLSDPILKGFLILMLANFGLTSALASACFVKNYGGIFLGFLRTDKLEIKEHVPISMRLGQGILSSICIILGLFASFIFQLFGYDFQLPNILFVGILIVLTYVFIFVFIKKITISTPRVTETWGCGYSYLGKNTEFTPSGFSEPIVSIFKDIYRPKKDVKVNHFDKTKSIVSGGTVHINLISIFEEYMYIPISKAFSKITQIVSKLENNNSNTYILYLFITLFFILLLLG